jgi:hypothetical protein
VAASYEYGNEIPVSIEDEEFLDNLKENQFLKQNMEFSCSPNTIQMAAGHLRDRGCDNVLRGQGYRTLKRAVIDGHGTMVE